MNITDTFLADPRLDIVDALYRFADGMDTDDGELIASAFTDDTTVDFRPAAGKVGMQFPLLEGRDGAVAALLPFAEAYTTSHSVGNARVSVDGDGATLTALVEAQHLPVADPSRHFMMKNRYELRLERDGERWLISNMTIRNLWTDGELAVMTEG